MRSLTRSDTMRSINGQNGCHGNAERSQMKMMMVISDPAEAGLIRWFGVGGDGPSLLSDVCVCVCEGHAGCRKRRRCVAVLI